MMHVFCDHRSQVNLQTLTNREFSSNLFYLEKTVSET